MMRTRYAGAGASPAHIALLLALTGLLGCSPVSRPNILLVVIDTARADRFPFGGYDRDTAPALRELAAGGVVYTAAYSPAPWTVPAHASLFTGQYPSLHRTDCGSLRLPDGAVTLAETLRAAGYRTVGYTANPWIGAGYNFQQGFDTYGEVWREVRERSPDTGATLTNERVERFLRWFAGNPDARRQPFFLFVNYFEPHLAYHPPEPERSRMLRRVDETGRVDELSRLGHPDEMLFILGRSPLTGGDLEILNDLYDGEIAYVDRRLGEVIAVLRQEGLLDGTVIAVTADHGENIGDHGLMDHKMSVHDTLLHVPLVLRYPPLIPAGRVIDEPVQMHDLYPTLLRLAGVQPAAEAIVEALPLPGIGAQKGGAERHDVIVGEFAGPPVDFLATMKPLAPGEDLTRFDRKLVALRRDGWKVHWGSDGRHALYHVAVDPGETRDLALSEPQRLESMVRDVGVWLNRPARRHH